MKLKKRIKMCAVILAAIIFFVLLFTASCSSKTDSAENNNKKEENAAVNENEADGSQERQENEQGEQRIFSEAPVKDFEGHKFRVLSRDAAATRWYARDITSEAETGDPFNDAVYRRNITIEDKFNIKIVNNMVSSENMLNSANKSIKSNSDDYDILMGGLNGFANTLSLGGMLVDLHKVPYLDLPKPWYDQKANEQLTIARQLYVTINEISTIDKDATWAYLFNKKLVGEYGLEIPYQLVRDGKWTIDKMLEMCKGISKDLNGDGKMDKDDLYGYAGEAANMYFGMLSAGTEMVKKDKDDMPVYTGLDDIGLNVFGKLISIMGDKNLMLRADDWYGKGVDVWGETGLMDIAFEENRILLFDTSMSRVQLYRNMEADFGIVPPPKRDESQTEYISNLTVAWTNSFCIPITASDLERTGIISDALAAESLYTVIPAYYDIQLKTKIARDDESSEMLDILFAGRKFDLGMIYNWGGLVDTIINAVQKNNPDIVSALEKIQGKVEAQIAQTIAKFEESLN